MIPMISANKHTIQRNASASAPGIDIPSCPLHLIPIPLHGSIALFLGRGIEVVDLGSVVKTIKW
jgi:hypothetical protein